MEFIPIIIGTQGGIFKSSTKALKSLDILTHVQKAVQRKLCDHFVNTLHKIVKQRRHLEAVKKSPDI